jgi:hypothetical protein
MTCRGRAEYAAGGRCGDESTHPANHESGAGTGAGAARCGQEEGYGEKSHSGECDDPALHAADLFEETVYATGIASCSRSRKLGKKLLQADLAA